jgi:hypothetical protein
MRVLLDEQMPKELAAELPGHKVHTIDEAGWKGLDNGALLGKAGEQFDALISMDKNMPVQQDVGRYSIGLVLVRAPSNRIESIRPLIPAILRALTLVRPGTVERVGA